jgi:hypothetical protein
MRVASDIVCYLWNSRHLERSVRQIAKITNSITNFVCVSGRQEADYPGGQIHS